MSLKVSKQSVSKRAIKGIKPEDAKGINQKLIKNYAFVPQSPNINFWSVTWPRLKKLQKHKTNFENVEIEQ